MVFDVFLEKDNLCVDCYIIYNNRQKWTSLGDNLSEEVNFTQSSILYFGKKFLEEMVFDVFLEKDNLCVNCYIIYDKGQMWTSLCDNLSRGSFHKVVSYTLVNIF